MELQALRDENQWLLQRLHASERSCSQLQSVIKQQQRRMKQLEKASQPAASQLERQWTTRLQQKENEWMHEYDAQMQSLLRIIQHHESVRAQLERELNEARTVTSVDLVSSASQTDFPSDGGDTAGAHDTIQHEEVIDRVCSSCSYVARHRNTEVDCTSWDQRETEEDCSAPPLAIQKRPRQQLLQRLQLSTRSRRSAQSSPISTAPTNFRASVLQRLRKSRRHDPLSQSRARSLPPTIPEEEEESDDESAKYGAPNLGSFECDAVTAATSSRPSVTESLEERNRVLQDRLASQQSVLDQLLSSRLHVATDNTSMTLTKVTTVPKETNRVTHLDQMIKLSDHLPFSAQASQGHTERAESLYPLSPTAA